MREKYTYQESLLKAFIDTFKESWAFSDKYTIALKIPLWILMFVVGLPVAILIDTFISWIKI